MTPREILEQRELERYEQSEELVYMKVMAKRIKWVMSDIGASRDIINRIGAVADTLDTLSKDVAICDVPLGLDLDDE